MADPFSVFTAGQVGSRAIEESRFRRGIDIQQQSLGLQERGLGIQERGQAQQFELQGRQETRLQGRQDLETAEGRLTAGLERVRMIASLEASRRLLKDQGLEDAGIGNFLDTQGGLKQSLKFAKLNNDQFELMVLREMESQRIQQREAGEVTLGAQERLLQRQPGGGLETIVPPVEAPAGPRSPTEIKGALFEKILASPEGLRDLTPQETQILSLDIVSQNPLAQLALAGGQTLADLLGGTREPSNDQERAIINRALTGMKDGVITPEQIAKQIKENEQLSAARKAQIAAILGLAVADVR